MTSKALGKGLSALISTQQEDKASTEGATLLSVVSIKNNSQQPRQDYDEEKLEELKSSIKENGVLQPILVREKDGFYEVIAGERRLRAARDLGLETIPTVIKEVTDQEALVIAIIENIQREELNPIEEAEAYKKLIEGFSLTQENIAKSVGKNRSTVANMMRILSLPDHMKTAVYKGKISAGHARVLVSVDSLVEKERLYDLAVNKDLSVRELENLAKQEKPSGQRRESSKGAIDYQVLALEEELQKALGTKVRIQASKKRGKIIIDYYSADDLDRVIGIIKK